MLLVPVCPFLARGVLGLGQDWKLAFATHYPCDREQVSYFLGTYTFSPPQQLFEVCTSITIT